ncbi:MAG: TonB-dependent receptor [Acidobacteria bacterium]|nr:TonB-dependent receptor [Acidobacteriota bacterium]
MTHLNWKRFFVVGILLLTLNSIALPQSPNGTVSGRVLDEKGAVIANAKLTLTNKGTALKREITADENGNYTFISIPPGTYTLTAEYTGFSKSQLNNIEVSVASQNELADITLKTGGMNELVMVNSPDTSTAPNAIINTDAGNAIAYVISKEQIAELPSLTRNVFEFVALSPGASPTSESRGIGLAVNGQRSSSGNYVVDGSENNNIFFAGPAQNLSMESIKEFRILTNNFTAEYGRNLGFIANIVSNVGSNTYHFNLFDFIRNSALAANSFDNNARGIARPNFNRHQFGGSLGGTVVKEKLFFFTAVEPIVVRSNGSVNFFVPTKQLLDRSVAGTRDIFTQTEAIIQRKNSAAFRPDGNQPGALLRTICPFGVTCPPNSQQGRITIPAYVPVTVNGPRNFGAGNPQNSVLASGRLDYNISEKMQLFGRYSLDYSDIFGQVNQPYSEDLYQGEEVRSHNIHLNLTRIWSNNLVSESRAIYGRAKRQDEATARVSNPAKGYLAIFGLFGVADDVSIPFGSSEFLDLQNTYQLYQTATYTKGEHLLKFGGQYYHAREAITPPVLNELPVAQFFGTQSFVNGVLGNYQLTFDPQGQAPGGNVIAPFSPGTIKRHYNYNEFSVFIQDTWKAHPRLTITPGLRYEYFGVLHSARSEKDLDANFYYGEGRSNLERIANGKFLRVSDAPSKYKGHFYLPDYKNFAPRFGIAWDMFGTGKTVLRSGVGVFYDRNFGNVLANVSVNPPSFAQTNFGGFILNSDLVKNPYALLPPGAQFTLSFTSGRHLDQNLKTAYSVSVNASLEHKVTPSLLMGLTYVGTRGERLYSLNNINKIDSGVLLGRPGDLVMAKDKDDKDVFLAEINTRGNLGYSSYNALQVRAETDRLKKLGLQLGANYTWSHSIDNVSSFFYEDGTANPVGFGFLDAFNPDLDRGASDFDTRHRFVTNFIWQIPFADNLSNRWVKHLLDGWEISGILSFQSGQPFSIFDRGTTGYDRTSSPRPILKGTLVKAERIPDASQSNTFLYLLLNPALNFTSLSSVNGPFTGAISRNIFRRPGTQYHNLAVMRNFSLPKIFGREGVKLQLRGEFYNAFNHANLYVNVGTNDIASNSFNGGSAFVPAVTVSRGQRIGRSSTGPLPSFIDNRQVVVAAKFIF